jgi:hypothetical protein
MGDGTDREQKYTSKGNGTYPSASRKAKQQAFAKAGQPTPPQFQDNPMSDRMDPEGGSQQGAAVMDELLGSLMDLPSAGGGPGAAVGGPSASGSANSSFGTAFKQARAQGLDQFEWNGKQYTTELADGTGSPQGSGAGVEKHHKGQPISNPKGKLAPNLPDLNGDGATGPDKMDNQQTRAMGGGTLDDIMNWIGMGAGAGAGVAAGDAASGAIAKGRTANAGVPQAKATARARGQNPADYAGNERQAYKMIESGDTVGAEAIAKKMQAVDPEAAAGIMQMLKESKGATGIPGVLLKGLKALGM